MTQHRLSSVLQTPLTAVHHDGKPRILYLITRAERGGAQMHVLSLACAMQKEFDVAVATGEQGFLVDECQVQGIPVYVLPNLKREIRLTKDARALWEIIQLIQQFKPDLIHAHTFKAGFLGRLSSRIHGVPSIYTIHTWLFGTPALPRLWGVLGAPCERLAARWSNRLIVVSDVGANIVRQHRIVQKSKMVTIHNGIPDCPERANLMHDHAPVICMVARFAKQKGQDVLLHAFARLSPGPRLRFIGGGPLLEHTKNLAKELGVLERVEFLGNRDDVPALLASSDIFVLTSEFEMFSLSILEAMRAGLPTVVSDVGGNSEAVVQGETGFLVPSGSTDALTEALSLLADNTALRVRFGNAARQRFVDLFLFEHQERQTRYVYDDVLYESRRIETQHRQKTAIETGEAPRKQAA